MTFSKQALIRKFTETILHGSPQHKQWLNDWATLFIKHDGKVPDEVVEAMRVLGAGT